MDFFQAKRFKRKDLRVQCTKEKVQFKIYFFLLIRGLLIEKLDIIKVHFYLKINPNTYLFRVM